MNYDLPKEVTVEGDGAVRIVRLNRPEKLNAVNRPMHDAMATLWGQLSADAGARAVVLTGAGRAFSAGGDMDWIRENATEHDSRRETLRVSAEVVRQMLHFPLPVVGAVNGPAVGLGCSLVVLSDIVLIADDAYLADPHVPVGLVAGDGGAVAWPFFMSILHAKEYLYTGDRIDAETAVRLGLANRVVPGAALLDDAVAFAQRLAKMPKEALQGTKQTLNTFMERSMAGILELALSLESESFTSKEHQASVAKLLERAR